MLACQPTDPPQGQPDAELSDAQLAQRYCGSCHLFPEPQLLDQSTWTQSVLPAMAWRLGIQDTAHQPLLGRNMKERFLVQQAGIFPDSARLSQESWQRLVHYYDSLAPAQLPPARVPPARVPPASSPVPFARQPVSLGLSSGGLTTLLRQHPQTEKIYLADGTRTLYQLSASGETEDFFELPGVVSDIYFRSDGTFYLLTVGNLNPHDEPLGRLVAMDAKGNVKSLVSALNRPVHLNVHDLDQDGQDDIVICEFGNHIGRLSWFRQTEEGPYEKRVLWERPGAVKTVVRDLDEDGRPDLLVLMAQAQEGVYAFYNQGDGRFSMKPLLEFPPVFGSSDFTLSDIDQDGDEDLILVNGDNADLSNILKPYHGVRVYRNEGSYAFSEAYFYPMYGATRVVSYDADQDGDADLAASAYFPDFASESPRSFVYLENVSKGSVAFDPHTPEGLNGGRWLLMEPLYHNQQPAGVMLGAFNIGFDRGTERVEEQWKGKNVNAVLLRSSLPEQ